MQNLESQERPKFTLEETFRNQSPPEVRERGNFVFERFGVEVLRSDKSRIATIVHDHDDCNALFAPYEPVLFYACSCNKYHGRAVCAHIWAAILHMDALSMLREVQTWKGQIIRASDDLYEELDEPKGRKSQVEDLVFDPTTTAIEVPTRSSAITSRVWEKQISSLSNAVKPVSAFTESKWPLTRELYFIVSPSKTEINGKLTIDISFRDRNKNGEWGKLKTQRIPLSQIEWIPSETERRALSVLGGARDSYGAGAGYYYSQYNFDSVPVRVLLQTELIDLVMPLMCATGRCVIESLDKNGPMPAVSWDEGPAWKFWLTAEKSGNDSYNFRGVLRREGETLELEDLLLLSRGVLIDHRYRAARVDASVDPSWVNIMRTTMRIEVPNQDVSEALARFLMLPKGPQFDLPEEIRFEEVHGLPIPQVRVRRPEYRYMDRSKLIAQILFQYGPISVDGADMRPGIFDPTSRKVFIRDQEAERLAYSKLKPLGFKAIRDFYEKSAKFEITPSNLSKAVRSLLHEGWEIEAEGNLYRKSKSMNFSVSSGIDWFELDGVVDFGDGLQAKLPALLTALRRGDSMVRLGDGSFGLLPEDWLEKYGALTSLGETDGDHVKFRRSQTGLLDALLAAQPEVEVDEIFNQARAEWRNFKGVGPIDPPESFLGTLREYQREGLGWFDFLRRFGFGGCLADDMGLGKTVQVLALLESRRVGNKVPGKLESEAKGKRASSKIANGSTLENDSNGQPSLVVVPRSLIFNWQLEAQRFTPQLRVLTHLGGERVKSGEHFQNYDLVLTTYGTLRRDAAHFKDTAFDYVILDEAQAIKNTNTESSKAARLLRGNHKLALSGTPIENHLGELWSLFEFLNPGLLGAASVFQLTGSAGRTPSEETRQILSRSLGPFILRRTKKQVATELPEKLEQTIYCEMEPAQRKQYDQLKEFYQRSLMEKVSEIGINRSKIHILEALLRLRQAACHPGLVNTRKAAEPSAKLETFIAHVAEVIEEGHKTLVFSQFTSFLALVQKRLNKEKIAYEYLDGKTVDRQARVERFQNDPDCKLFLISLKAGGQGLNLTAAEYVFLLDPWWNPAVESQAIDRAHRIGQTRRVFAYRLITKDTVEEKVLALQDTKRDLADAIIGANESVIGTITKEDLLLLLS